MSAPLVRGSALARRRLQGIAFLLVLAALVGVTVLQYRKAFTPVVHITLEADRVGNQLTQGADVKLRGVRVGEVRSVGSRGDKAVLDLALDEDRAKAVPASVTARFLPKTLFGEKYVALDYTVAGEPVAEDAVIGQDRTSTALETEQALDDLLPLLRALRPQDLSRTLNALSSALRGRGDVLGRNLQRTGAYLARLNPSLPTLQQDLAGLADLAQSTADATPAILQVLDNLSFSSRSVVDQQGALDTFLSTTTGFAASAQSIVADNERRLVALATDSLPVLQTYAKEADGYPCLLEALAAQEPTIEKTFGGGQPGLHLTLEVTQDNGPYVPGQEPKNGDTGGKLCYSLDPDNPVRPATLYYNPYDGYYDGMEVDPITGKPPCTHQPCAYPPDRGGQGDAVVRGAAAPLLGVPSDEVPDLAVVLLGPVAQGATLSYASES